MHFSSHTDCLTKVELCKSKMFLGVVLSPELDVMQKNEENKQLQEVEQEKLKTTAEEDEIICDDTFQMEAIVEIFLQKQKTAALTVHPVVLLPKLVVQENEENKQLQEVEQDKLKATAEEDEIICDDTFQVETCC